MNTLAQTMWMGIQHNWFRNCPQTCSKTTISHFLTKMSKISKFGVQDVFQREKSYFLRDHLPKVEFWQKVPKITILKAKKIGEKRLFRFWKKKFRFSKKNFFYFFVSHREKYFELSYVFLGQPEGAKNHDFKAKIGEKRLFRFWRKKISIFEKKNFFIFFVSSRRKF